MVKLRLERKIKGEWYTYGAYFPEEPALVRAIILLSQNLSPEEIRLVEEIELMPGEYRENFNFLEPVIY